MSAPEQIPAQTILIVDADLGFLIWLGRVLSSKGYLALPSTTIAEALKVLGNYGLEAPDLMIVDPTLPGIPVLVDALKRRHWAMKVIETEDSSRAPFDIQETQAELIDKVQWALRKNSAAGGS